MCSLVESNFVLKFWKSSRPDKDCLYFQLHISHVRQLEQTTLEWNLRRMENRFFHIFTSKRFELRKFLQNLQAIWLFFKLKSKLHMQTLILLKDSKLVAAKWNDVKQSVASNEIQLNSIISRNKIVRSEKSQEKLWLGIISRNVEYLVIYQRRRMTLNSVLDYFSFSVNYFES